MFSKSCEYALQAVLYIALNSKKGESVALKEISESQNIPLHFLSKILQELVKSKILNSTKGPNGGFSLAQSPAELHLLRIVEIIDGLDIFDRCGIGLKKCSDDTPCPIHFDYQSVKEKIRDLLTRKTLHELADDLKEGNAIVSLDHI